MWVPSEEARSEETIPVLDVTGIEVVDAPTNPYD